MDVGENQISIALEGIEHAVTVVRVDVHVGHAPDAMHRAQRLDRHAQIVEHAEARGGIAARVVQPGDGHERAAAFPVEHGGDGIQYRADNDTRGLVYARKRGGCRRHRDNLRQCVTACARARCSRGCETARDRPQYRQPERRPRPVGRAPDVAPRSRMRLAGRDRRDGRGRSRRPQAPRHGRPACPRVFAVRVRPRAGDGKAPGNCNARRRGTAPTLRCRAGIILDSRASGRD